MQIFFVVPVRRRNRRRPLVRIPVEVRRPELSGPFVPSGVATLVQHVDDVLARVHRIFSRTERAGPEGQSGLPESRPPRLVRFLNSGLQNLLFSPDSKRLGGAALDFVETIPFSLTA